MQVHLCCIAAALIYSWIIERRTEKKYLRRYNKMIEQFIANQKFQQQVIQEA